MDIDAQLSKFNKVKADNGITADAESIANSFSKYLISIGRSLSDSIPVRPIYSSPSDHMGERSYVKALLLVRYSPFCTITR